MNSPNSSHVITQKDIAKALGLTQATVSLALRDDSRIPVQRRIEIQAAAKKMGYRPNPTATTLAYFKQSSKVKPMQAALAWLNCWQNPGDLHRLQEFELYWQGARVTAEKFGYHLEEFIWNPAEPFHRLEKILTSRGIKGILLPPHNKQPDWGDFQWKNFSTVRFGRSVTIPCIHVVTADQVANMILAFESIRQLGYQRIALVAESVARNWHLFEAGYLMAQQKVDESNRLQIFRIDQSSVLQEKIMKDFVRWIKKEKPDAIITSIPETREMVKKAGYHVPEEILVAAMSVLDGHSSTGIYQNSGEIGRAAVLLLISMIHDNDCGVPELHREILIKGKWVDGSTLPPGRKQHRSTNTR